MMKYFRNQYGLSLIATVLALLIFALFAAVAVSLVTTGSNIGVQEEQGQQAFYIAEGGLQYASKLPFPNHFTQTPPAAPVYLNLGAGSFTTSVPYLTAAINDTNNTIATINVSSTDGFVQAAPPGETNYWVMICAAPGNPTPNLTATSTCEKINFPTKNPTSFSGGAGNNRGRDSSVPALHPQNAVVLMYTWNIAITTNLNGNLSAAATTVNVNSTAGFASPPALIRIMDANLDQIEDVMYTGITATSFTGCTRKAFNGNGNGYAHNGTQVFQSEISVLTTSTGTVSNILSNNVMRRVQGAFMPLQ